MNIGSAITDAIQVGGHRGKIWRSLRFIACHKIATAVVLGSSVFVASRKFKLQGA